MSYNFYGWKNSSVQPINNEFKGIGDPCQLYDALTEIWCEYTCAPRLREKWSRDNITLGQCSVTAFLAQDIFGGKVYVRVGTTTATMLWVILYLTLPVSSSAMKNWIIPTTRNSFVKCISQRQKSLNATSTSELN